MRISREDQELAMLAVSTYGREKQLDCLIEEMAELIVAINHHRRLRIQADKVVEEIADVLVMLDQVAYLYGENNVSNEIDFSQEKLKKKLRARGVKI